VWVVNVAGTAGLIEMQYHYARNPTPPTWTHLIGQTFVARPHIDYPFVDPPDSLPIKKRDGFVTKSGIIVVDADPQQLIQHVTAPDDALAFLETHLPMRPEDAMLFHEYEERLTTLKKQDRGETFLKPGLDRKPVEVNWHRTYQNLLESQGRIDDLRTEYDRRLEAEPDSAMLLYLRSRFEGEAKVRREFMTKARDADPENPWPHFGLGFQAAIEGDWPAALTELQVANAKGLDPDLSQRMITLARLGSGESAKIVEESKAALASTPMDIAALFGLIDAYVSTGRLAEAQQELDAWKAQRQAILSSIAPVVEMLRLHILYGGANFTEFQQAPPPGNDTVVQRYHAAFHLANGQPGKVAADPLLAPKDEMPWDALALSVAYHLAHDDVESERWLTKACERFKARGAEERMAAAMLTTLDPPDFEAVRDLSLEPSQKLLFLCAVAQQFPALAAQAGELAAKLNVTSVPPYQLVRSVFPASKGATTDASEKAAAENETKKESGT
jgi:tetratricopeptide (TPR) repeat protein